MILVRHLMIVGGIGIAEIHAVTTLKIEGATVRATINSYDGEQRMLQLGMREVLVPFAALLVPEAGGDPAKAVTLWLVSPDGPLSGGTLLEPDPIEGTRSQMLAEIERQRAAANAKADQLASAIAKATAEQLPTIVVSETPNNTAGASDV